MYDCRTKYRYGRPYKAYYIFVCDECLEEIQVPHQLEVHLSSFKEQGWVLAMTNILTPNASAIMDNSASSMRSLCPKCQEVLEPKKQEE